MPRPDAMMSLISWRFSAPNLRSGGWRSWPRSIASLSVRWSPGLQRTLKEAMDRGQDLQPPLRKFGAEKRQEIKDIIASGRGMPPLSPRTLENYARTGTSKVNKRGNVRASYAKRLANEKKRL